MIGSLSSPSVVPTFGQSSSRPASSSMPSGHAISSRSSPGTSTTEAGDSRTNLRLLQEMEALRAEVANLRRGETQQSRILDDPPPLYE